MVSEGIGEEREFIKRAGASLASNIAFAVLASPKAMGGGW